MKIFNFFKKKEKPIFDNRYQYSDSFDFFWNPITKKIQGINNLDDVHDHTILYKRCNITWDISINHTFNDFLKQYNHHHIVFFQNKGVIIKHKTFSFYAEIDEKKIRKEKLQKIKENND